MKEIIKNVGERLKKVTNYRFLRWRGTLKYPYFVGELMEEESGEESGIKEYRFILTGFYRGDNEISLYDDAESIKEIFPEDGGCMIQCKDGGMLVSWGSMLPDIPTDTDTELTKMQITLNVKRWKGR